MGSLISGMAGSLAGIFAPVSGEAAGGHNICPLPKRGNNWPRAQTGVGKPHALLHRIKVATIEHVRRRKVLQLLQNLVACHNGDARLPASPCKSSAHSRCGAGWIESAGITYKADFLLRHRRPHTQQHGHHIPSVAECQIALQILSQDGQRELGQLVTGNVLHSTALDARKNGFQRVSVETQPGTNPD